MRKKEQLSAALRKRGKPASRPSAEREPVSRPSAGWKSGWKSASRLWAALMAWVLALCLLAGCGGGNGGTAGAMGAASGSRDTGTNEAAGTDEAAGTNGTDGPGQSGPDGSGAADGPARYRLAAWLDGTLLLARVGGSPSEVYAVPLTDSVEAAMADGLLSLTGSEGGGNSDQETLAPDQETLAPDQDALALDQDALAPDQDALAPDREALVGCLMELDAADGTAGTAEAEQADDFPARLDVSALRVLPEGFDNRISLYLRVLEDLWALDESLNENLSCLGVDLSGTSLSPAEQTAAAYLFGTAHGLWPQTIQGTWQDLADRGLITGEPVDGAAGGAMVWQWKDGCLFIVTEKDWNYDLFPTSPGEARNRLEHVFFDAVKWRTSLRAAFLTDCTAWQDSAGRWGSYNVGLNGAD